jgi:uncharacterized membrane protein
MPTCALNLKSESETATFSPVKRMVDVIFPANIYMYYSFHTLLYQDLKYTVIIILFTAVISHTSISIYLIHN